MLFEKFNYASDQNIFLKMEGSSQSHYIYKLTLILLQVSNHW
jgi:hypothetical protein